VYAWLPLAQNSRAPSGKEEPFLSEIFFDKKIRADLLKTYEEFVLYSPFFGLYFSDDLYLTDEQLLASPKAQAAYQEKFGEPLTESLLQNAAKRRSVAAWQSELAIELTKDITAVVKAVQPELRTVRAISPDAVLLSGRDSGYGQEYRKILASYDYVMINAYDIDIADRGAGKRRLAALAAAALREDWAEDQVIFALPSYDYAKNRWLRVSEIKYLTKDVVKQNIKFFAYRPETLLAEDLWYFPNIRDKNTFG
jgi:hypothetical protein